MRQVDLRGLCGVDTCTTTSRGPRWWTPSSVTNVGASIRGEPSVDEVGQRVGVHDATSSPGEDRSEITFKIVTTKDEQTLRLGGSLTG